MVVNTREKLKTTLSSWVAIGSSNRRKQEINLEDSEASGRRQSTRRKWRRSGLSEGTLSSEHTKSIKVHEEVQIRSFEGNVTPTESHSPSPSYPESQFSTHSGNPVPQEIWYLQSDQSYFSDGDTSRKRKSGCEDLDNLLAHRQSPTASERSDTSAPYSSSSISRSTTFNESEASYRGEIMPRRDSNTSTVLSRSSTACSQSFESLPLQYKRQRQSAYVTWSEISLFHGTETSSTPNLVLKKPGSPPPGSMSLKRKAIKNQSLLQRAPPKSETICTTYQSDPPKETVNSVGNLVQRLQETTLQASGRFEQTKPSTYGPKKPIQGVDMEDATIDMSSADDQTSNNPTAYVSQTTPFDEAKEYPLGAAMISYQITPPIDSVTSVTGNTPREFEIDLQNSKVYKNSRAKQHKPSLSLTVPDTTDCSKSVITMVSHISTPCSVTTCDSDTDTSIASDYEGDDWLDNLIESLHSQCLDRVLERAVGLIDLDAAVGTRSRTPSRGPPENRAGGSAVSPARSNRSKTSHISSKRPLTPGGDEEPDDGEDRDPSKRQKTATGHVMESKKTNHQFACPYPKKYPHVQYSCADRSFKDTHRLKEHLYKRHKQILCPRCRRKFDNEKAMEQHNQADVACERNENTPNPELGFDSGTEATLRLRRDLKRLTERQRWEKIYKTLFPEDIDLPMPYIEVKVYMDGDKNAEFRDRLQTRMYDELVLRFREFEDNVKDRLREVIRNVTEEAIVDTFGEEHSDLANPRAMSFRVPEPMRAPSSHHNRRNTRSSDFLRPQSMDDIPTLEDDSLNGEISVQDSIDQELQLHELLQSQTTINLDKFATTNSTLDVPAMRITSAENEDNQLKVATSEPQSQPMSFEWSETWINTANPYECHYDQQ